MHAKARGLDADQFFLDLEDSVAPAAKEQARHNIVASLLEGGWGDKVRVVRVNDWTTQWTYQDVMTVVGAAGDQIDAIMLPKVQTPGQVEALDLLLTQIEMEKGFDVGAIGIEVQLENALGMVNLEAIATASARVETLVYGPADLMASLNMKSLIVGGQPKGYPADAYHYILMRILMVARANGLQAIDGPFGLIRDIPAFEEATWRSAALGFDGKWVLHPGQIGPANSIFSPAQEEYDKAENILDAYAWYTSPEGGALGAVMLGDDFIDEASRKMAAVIAAKGRSAGLKRTAAWTRPEP
ncbi:aldolase/citrate lyase family protein [Microbacterium soli]|uniref:Aldolase/citrate lyase family protein n=2 Tax=Microbacterium soli TaxID=446075 RepID=A0ABP7MW84_9MICO